MRKQMGMQSNRLPYEVFLAVPTRDKVVAKTNEAVIYLQF